MAKTFQEIQVDIANIFRSTIDPDDMALENGTEEEYLNVASSCYTVAMRLLNENNFPFNVYDYKFKTKPQRYSYKGVSGQIVKDGVYTSDSFYPLKYDKKGFLLDNENVGSPSKFWVDVNENIVLYPTPDDVYDITVRFKDMRYFLDEFNVPQLEPSPKSTLRMPTRLQAAFIDWLKYETLVNYIKNLAKPRYQPLIDEANKLKLAFLKLSNAYEDEGFLAL